MDPRTKQFSPSHQKALVNDAKLLAALEQAPDGLLACDLVDVLGYSRKSSIFKPVEDLNLRLLEQRSPFRVRRYVPRRIKGRLGQVLYKLEPRNP